MKSFTQKDKIWPEDPYRPEPSGNDPYDIER